MISGEHSFSTTCDDVDRRNANLTPGGQLHRRCARVESLFFTFSSFSSHVRAQENA